MIIQAVIELDVCNHLFIAYICYCGSTNILVMPHATVITICSHICTFNLSIVVSNAIFMHNRKGKQINVYVLFWYDGIEDDDDN